MPSVMGSQDWISMHFTQRLFYAMSRVDFGRVVDRDDNREIGQGKNDSQLRDLLLGFVVTLLLLLLLLYEDLYIRYSFHSLLLILSQQASLGR